MNMRTFIIIALLCLIIVYCLGMLMAMQNETFVNEDTKSNIFYTYILNNPLEKEFFGKRVRNPAVNVGSLEIEVLDVGDSTVFDENTDSNPVNVYELNPTLYNIVKPNTEIPALYGYINPKIKGLLENPAKDVFFLQVPDKKDTFRILYKNRENNTVHVLAYNIKNNNYAFNYLYNDRWYQGNVNKIIFDEIVIVPSDDGSSFRMKALLPENKEVFLQATETNMLGFTITKDPNQELTNIDFSLVMTNNPTKDLIEYQNSFYIVDFPYDKTEINMMNLLSKSSIVNMDSTNKELLSSKFKTNELMAFNQNSLPFLVVKKKGSFINDFTIKNLSTMETVQLRTVPEGKRQEIDTLVKSLQNKLDPVEEEKVEEKTAEKTEEAAETATEEAVEETGEEEEKEEADEEADEEAAEEATETATEEEEEQGTLAKAFEGQLTPMTNQGVTGIYISEPVATSFASAFSTLMHNKNPTPTRDIAAITNHQLNANSMNEYIMNRPHTCDYNEPRNTGCYTCGSNPCSCTTKRTMEKYYKPYLPN